MIFAAITANARRGSECESNRCKAKPGSACSNNTECQSGNYCNPLPSGTCQSRIALNASCVSSNTNPNQCQSGLACDSVTNQCKAASGSCSVHSDCQTGFYCNASSCTQQITAGGTCSGDNAECQGSAVCQSNVCKAMLNEACSSDGHCQSNHCSNSLCKVAFNGSCSNDNECSDSLACRGGRCVGVQGSDCENNHSVCSDSLYCNTYTSTNRNTCQPRLMPGGSCANVAQCTSNAPPPDPPNPLHNLTCRSGKCSDGTASSACTSWTQCRPGFYCNFWDNNISMSVCHARGRVGESCVDHGQCASGLACHLSECSDGNFLSTCIAQANCNNPFLCQRRHCRAPARHSCNANSDCVSGAVCRSGECADGGLLNTCTVQVQCHGGRQCQNGRCRAPARHSCNANSDCVNGSVCRLNECSDGSSGTRCTHISSHCHQTICNLVTKRCF